jgi:hypothetical protein
MQDVHIIHQLLTDKSVINYKITTTLWHIILHTKKNLKMINLIHMIFILNSVFTVVFYAMR